MNTFDDDDKDNDNDGDKNCDNKDLDSNDEDLLVLLTDDIKVVLTYRLQIIGLKIQSLKKHALFYFIDTGQVIVCKTKMLQICKAG